LTCSDTCLPDGPLDPLLRFILDLPVASTPCAATRLDRVRAMARDALRCHLEGRARTARRFLRRRRQRGSRFAKRLWRRFEPCAAGFHGESCRNGAAGSRLLHPPPTVHEHGVSNYREFSSVHFERTILQICRWNGHSSQKKGTSYDRRV
jgi:hypothetical protein